MSAKVLRSLPSIHNLLLRVVVRNGSVFTATRETWGSVKEVAGKRIRVAFLRGKPIPPEPKAKKVMLSEGEESNSGGAKTTGKCSKI